MTIADLMQQIENTERLIAVYRNADEVIVGTEDKIYSRRGLITDIPQIPGPLGVILRSPSRGGKRNSIAIGPLAAKKTGLSAAPGQNSRFCLDQGAPLPSPAAASHQSPGHAGAGGARRRAISDRILANICRGTATSAIWNVT